MKGGHVFRQLDRETRAKAMDYKLPEKFSLDTGLGDRELKTMENKDPRGAVIRQSSMESLRAENRRRDKINALETKLRLLMKE